MPARRALVRLWLVMKIFWFLITIIAIRDTLFVSGEFRLFDALHARRGLPRFGSYAAYVCVVMPILQCGCKTCKPTS